MIHISNILFVFNIGNKVSKIMIVFPILMQNFYELTFLRWQWTCYKACIIHIIQWINNCQCLAEVCVLWTLSSFLMKSTCIRCQNGQFDNKKYNLYINYTVYYNYNYMLCLFSVIYLKSVYFRNVEGTLKWKLYSRGMTAQKSWEPLL
jgi:hypothetical protein